MAATNTTRRASSKKTSKKQVLPTINNLPLLNLMLTGETTAVEPTGINTDQHISPEILPETTSQSSEANQPVYEPASLWEGIKNSPQFSSMVIGLICAFFVSAAFYGAAKAMMKTKFEDMFAEKLPRYKNLVYGIGSIQNIDVDRVLLRDDLNDQYFILDEENNSITMDVQKIFEQYKQEQLSSSQETFAKHNSKNIVNQFQDDQTDNRLNTSQILESSIRASLPQSKKQSSV